jgi:cytochrome c556
MYALRENCSLKRRRLNNVRLSDESTAKFEIELVNKQVQKIKQAKKDCQTHYGKQLGCGTCKALQLCMWIDELVDTIEAMRKHIEALQAENEQLQELAKAKADGRLVVLPCNVGTRVWVIGQDCDLCHDMYTEEPCLFGDCEYRKVIESVFLPGMIDEFGKTVFLSREEAEKALGGETERGKEG